MQQDLFSAEEHFNEYHRGFDYLEHAREVARELGRSMAVVTIDDVSEAAPTPEHLDGRILGAVFTKPDWEAVGYTRTRKPTAHRGIRRTWRYIGE